MTKTVAEQIRDLHALHESGAITEEEFSNAKSRLLGTLNKRSGESAGDTFSNATNAVTSAFSNSLSDSAPSFKNLAWVLYWGTVAVNLIGLFPIFAWVSLVVGIGIVVVAAMKMSSSVGTIYNSHFRNIVIVAVVSLVGYFLLLLITIGTLGLGIIITGPLFIALMIWYIYRVVKGMMRLNEGTAI